MRRLTLGLKGEDVRDWQRTLNALGADPPLKVDGDFATKSTAATRAFQKRREGLRESGDVDASTRRVAAVELAELAGRVLTDG